MDLYGKLNNEIVKKEYAGSTTDTAKTIVDNNSNVIKTEVKKVPGKLKIQYDRDPELEAEYDGSNDITLHIPELGDFERLKEETERINLQEDTEEKGKLIFTPAVGDPIKVQGGFLPDDNTLQLNSENELTLKKVYVDSSTVLGDGTSTNPLRGNVASKTNLGMVYAWKDVDGTINITTEEPIEE